MKKVNKIIGKWEASGLLAGLTGLVQSRLAKLFEPKMKQKVPKT